MELEKQAKRHRNRTKTAFSTYRMLEENMLRTGSFSQKRGGALNIGGALIKGNTVCQKVED